MYIEIGKGLAEIFLNAFFQLNRNLQVWLQKRQKKQMQVELSLVCCVLSENSFGVMQRSSTQLDQLQYGFGTYIHKIPGYFSRETV
jgi:hypothetical protein